MFTSRTRDANMRRERSVEPLELALLLAEALHDAHAGDVFLDDVGDVARLLLRVPARREHRRAQPHRGEEQRGRDARASRSASSGDRMSIATSDTMNSKMFATPIGRNCRKPWISATSDDARLTS